jgi:peptide/nickel transport system substrate-binding protein
MQPGVKWSDGQPVTAKDVAFTFNLMMTSPIAATANGNFVANFKTVTAPTDNTVVIITTRPQATMLALDVPIVPEHIWAGIKDLQHYTNYPTPGHPVVGDGPFILTGYKQGQYVKLAANKNYWRGAPKIDEIDFVHYDNADAEVEALKKGEVDLINNLTPDQFKSLQGNPDIATNEAEGARFVDLAMNPGAETGSNIPIGSGNAALKDVKFRDAIGRSIDLNALVQKVYNGYATVGTGYIPLKYKTYHWNPPASIARTFDTNAANKELDQAGYPRGADGQRVGKDGKPLTLSLLADTEYSVQPVIAQYIKGWLADVGITVNVQSVSTTRQNDLTNGGDYDMSISQWGTDPDPDYGLSLQICAQRPDAQGHTNNSENFFCNAQYDNLYKQQLSEMNATKRVQLVDQAQQLFYQQVPEVTLLYPNELEAYRSDRWAPFTIQPQPGGQIMAQNGYWGYYSATPASAAAAGSSGSSTGLIIGIVIAVVVVVIGGGAVILLLRRRRGTADERE